MIQEFTTENFLVRPIRLDDASLVFEHWAQEIDIAKYMTWKPHKDVEETELFIESCLDGWQNNDFTWLIETEQDKQVIGSFAASRNGSRIETGYLLRKEYWGKGYIPEVIRAFITKAFKIDGVFRVWAVCDVDNLASKRAMEKGGLEPEGILKSWLVHPNIAAEPRDCHCLSIINNHRPSIDLAGL